MQQIYIIIEKLFHILEFWSRLDLFMKFDILSFENTFDACGNRI